MSEFGDYEPEDAWHPDDPVPILVFNLLARLDLLDMRRDGGSHADDLLDLIEARVERWNLRRDELTARERLRIDHLLEDLAHVRSRRG